MMLTRRRFLTITAAALAAPAAGHAQHWHGRAFGADVAITLTGPAPMAAPALAAARARLRAVEAAFNLYDSGSDLRRLNATGQLDAPGPLFGALMDHADRMHRATDGHFDPTVQPLWQAIAQGADTAAARRAIGWHRVVHRADRITLGRGQALTFNGIAQGFATDLVTQTLQAHGLTNCLVNMGEHRATGGPYRLGLHDPLQGSMGHRTLTDRAIATSSPAATPLGPQGHILHARATPHWSTVSVEADTATVADAASTAFVLMQRPAIARAAAALGLHRVTLIDTQGDLATL
ncbi:FAD:protein FMN transferase [Sulfitobacter sp. S190]|uniref:FAD:protein FMN transferase n=1 Tax=Sulfitobacter sp. S190 TaxID=2867022 RepID=UPI0021A699AA|nr:FAD:protein FMN transferase [Sulfitobacter sp. S190]UWR21903.1 FAD:protein FMN transferase [Sulfitobacter sp. S190]